MSKITKQNFEKIIAEIESMEIKEENIWIPIGILEIMYDDDIGYIDEYFHKESKFRDLNMLWDNLKK